MAKARAGVKLAGASRKKLKALPRLTPLPPAVVATFDHLAAMQVHV